MQPHQCPRRVVWHLIPWNHIIYHPKLQHISFTRSDDEIIIPHHLAEPDIRQYHFHATFKETMTLEEMEHYIQYVGAFVFDGNTATTCYGILFRRHRKPHYWGLRGPCLSCYIDDIDDDIPNVVLSRRL